MTTLDNPSNADFSAASRLFRLDCPRLCRLGQRSGAHAGLFHDPAVFCVLAPNLPAWGRLPGDIVIERENSRID
ncbi:MAG: DUF2905 family protein [Isosphaeraceae bacterium]